MIVVDTSALVAVFLREPGHEAMTEIIDDAQAACLSVVSRIELVSVLCGVRIGAEPARVGDYVDGLNLEHVPVSVEQMHGALDALLTFGKGRHPAQLNLGDCFSYALAKARGAPLLFKGDDFARTDIVPAWTAPR
ncbi:MAG TPA: type II toxin-antitoxin system VapC family toxin [Microvirga sp.]|nr:type II toxin-antitoxin system VapC family toxin [Microvirga sp.]